MYVQYDNYLDIADPKAGNNSRFATLFQSFSGYVMSLLFFDWLANMYRMNKTFYCLFFFVYFSERASFNCFNHLEDSSSFP